MPAGLDVGGVVVVLGVLDPAGSEGEFLVVLEELVAGAIGADEFTVLGVTCKRSISSVMIHREVLEAYRCTIRRKASVVSQCRSPIIIIIRVSIPHTSIWRK